MSTPLTIYPYNRCTTAKLASILNAALVRHIHSSLPDLKQAVSDEIYRVERQLDALGDPVKGTKELKHMESKYRRIGQRS